MKLFQTIGEFLRTLFVPAEAPKKPLKPGAQTHGGFRDGFEKAAGKPVNLTGVTPALIVVPEEVAEPAPQPDNDFVASLDDLPLDAMAPVSESPIDSTHALANQISDSPSEPTNSVAAEPSATAGASSELTTSETLDRSIAIDAPVAREKEASSEPTGSEAAPNEAYAEPHVPEHDSTRALMAMMGAMPNVPGGSSARQNHSSNEAPSKSENDSTSGLMATMDAVLQSPPVPPREPLNVSTETANAPQNDPTKRT